MELKNVVVTHPRDGKGIITDFYKNSNHFVVKFNNGAERHYQYPNDFKYNILKIDDAAIMAQIEKDLLVLNNKATSFEVDGTLFYGQKDNKVTPAPELNPAEVNELKKGFSYGTNALEIYDALCQNFNWDTSKRNYFAKMKSLGEKACTPEGYTVWFMAYSSYTMTKKKKSNGIVNNLIIGSNDIEEICDLDAKRKPTDYIGEIRIVFVKNNFGQYEFWGVLRTTEVECEIPPYRVYGKYISDTYSPGKKYC